VCFLTGCGLTPPKPVQSEYFASEWGGFTADRKKREIYYGLTVTSRMSIPAGSYIEVQFENPSGGAPLVKTHVVESGERTFAFESPPVSGLKAHSNYNVKVSLYEDNTKRKLLGTHKQSLQNLINQKDLGW
jgi:hypothetical protein